MKSRVCDCCRSGTGCAVCSETRRAKFHQKRVCVSDFCRGSVLRENRRPSLTGRFLRLPERRHWSGPFCCGTERALRHLQQQNSVRAVFCCGGAARTQEVELHHQTFRLLVPAVLGRVTRSRPGGPSFRHHQDALRVRVLLCGLYCAGTDPSSAVSGPDRPSFTKRAAGLCSCEVSLIAWRFSFAICGSSSDARNVPESSPHFVAQPAPLCL